MQIFVFLHITPVSGVPGAAIGKPNPGGGMENCGGIPIGGPGGNPGGGMNGADGKIGGTNVEAMFGAGGYPGIAAGGGMPSFDA